MEPDTLRHTKLTCHSQPSCRGSSSAVKSFRPNPTTVSERRHSCRSAERCSSGPAVKVPGLVFCAGQTATGEIKQATVSHLIFVSQIHLLICHQRTALLNLKEVLELAGSSLDKVVKYNGGSALETLGKIVG